MFLSEKEALESIVNNDVKFIRLSFCDIDGVQKNISIMPSQLTKAFLSGIAIDASLIRGFSDNQQLYLFPDPNTLALLPWRPSQGRVVRFYCDIKYADKTPFEKDGRYLLKRAIEMLKKEGFILDIGSNCEFYLFEKNDKNQIIPFDNAGYLDVAPLDKGENVRREICLTLEEMGIAPESSHHEAGPGQNEIDFKYSDPLEAADNLITLKYVISTIAERNGLVADFGPKPLENSFGNGLMINITVNNAKDMDNFLAGVFKYISEITYFLNPLELSYTRLNETFKSSSQIIRTCEEDGKVKIVLATPDSTINPYHAYAVLLLAGFEGIRNKLPLNESANPKLPNSLNEAYKLALESELVNKHLPKNLIEDSRK